MSRRPKWATLKRAINLYRERRLSETVLANLRRRVAK